MERILKGYREGTDYGIHMDEDGMILAGEGLWQVTWMDVRVGEDPSDTAPWKAGGDQCILVQCTLYYGAVCRFAGSEVGISGTERTGKAVFCRAVLDGRKTLFKGSCFRYRGGQTDPV